MRGIFAFAMLASPDLAHADEAPDPAESKPTRPPPPKPLEPTPLPESRHIDVGAGVALVERVVEGQTTANGSYLRYPAAVGVSLSARIQLWKYLRTNLYVVHASTSVDMPNDALGLPGNPAPVSLATYSFGLRLAPTIPIGPRARTWISAGAGWGRFEFGRFNVVDEGISYQVRERAFTFIEFPMGIGTSFEVIKNWLSVEFEATAVLHTSQRGTALRNAQVIDTTGSRKAEGPFPSLTASFVQTLGLTLIL